MAAPVRDLGAQRVLGPGDDAFVLPRGVLRVSASARWEGLPDRYDSDGFRIPLGAEFSRDNLGVADVSALASAGAPLRALANQPTLALSLGTVRASLDRSRVVTPIIAELGVTSRITAFVNVPYVRTRTDVAVDVNPRGSATANVGLNPALTFTGARTRNAGVGSALRGAATTLEQLLAACKTDATGPLCGPVLADVPGANALIASARDVATRIEQSYGTADAPGTPFIPIQGTALQKAIDDRLAALGTSFSTLLGATVAIGTPLAAQVPITVADLQGFVGSCEAGLCASALGTVQRSHLGDIELGTRVKLLDTFGGDERRRTTPSGLNARFTVGALVRLGTGQVDSPEDLADLGTGDGQTDIEGLVATDILAGQRFWLTVTGRYGVQLADRPRMRVPAYVGQGYIPAAQEGEVDRKLGDYYDLQATPHWVFGQYFAAFASWRYRAKAEDTYRGSVIATDSAGTSTSFDASILGVATDASEQHVGFGITYSTVAAFERGKSVLPYELSLVRTQTVSGRNAPNLADAMVQFRVYPRLLGGTRR